MGMQDLTPIKNVEFVEDMDLNYNPFCAEKEQNLLFSWFYERMRAMIPPNSDTRHPGPNRRVRSGVIWNLHAWVNSLQNINILSSFKNCSIFWDIKVITKSNFYENKNKKTQDWS